MRLTREAINPLAGRVPVVDLMCDARSYQPGIYSSDGFHPNDQGYAYLAEVLLQAITSGVGTGPAGQLWLHDARRDERHARDPCGDRGRCRGHCRASAHAQHAWRTPTS